MKHLHWIPLIAAVLVGCRSREEAPFRPRVEVKLSRAEEADVVVAVRAPAIVFAKAQANVSSRVTAPVRELVVRKGDSVTAGQILARLENRDFLAQRVEAAAALSDAEASLAKISSGTLPTEIERARGLVETTRAALNQAQRFYERRKQLFDHGAIPSRDLLVSETELVQAKTNHEVALKTLELFEGQSKERDLQIARSRVEQARGRLAFIEAQLSYTDIRSPFAGTVTEQFVFPGDMARPDAALFTVADLSFAVARAQVPEANASDVRRSQVCRLHPADRPDAAFTGTVTVVNRAVDTARRTVEVWCEIVNGGANLRAGVFGTVVIETGSLKKAVVIPIPAVQFEEGTSTGYVMVVGHDRKVSRRKVETTSAGGEKVAVLQGLRTGEAVIVEGGYGLEDGTEVTWREVRQQGTAEK